MKRNLPILLLLLLAFLLGISTLTNRGEGWDEFLLHKYAVRSLNAYQTWPLEGQTTITVDNLGAYGPSFLMLDETLFRSLSVVLPLHITDIYHLINFILYLTGIWAFYDIGNRWLTPASTLGSALLLMTQPVFWGHAFMNSKDIPFFSFFLLSLAVGFRMMDEYKPIPFSTPTRRINRTLTLLTTFWLVSVFGVFAFTGAFHSLIENFVRSAAAGNENIVSPMVSHLRPETIDVYIHKFFMLFLRVRAAYVGSFTLVLLYLYYRYSRATLQSILPILLPGLLLGMTASTRILGPFAGLIVAAYGLRLHGKKAFAGLFTYAVIGMIIMYLTWPFLWEDPTGNFIESIKVMSSYPWNGTVLFNGQRYISTELPYSYLPVLFGIQLTEPVWFLFMIGFVITVIESRPKQINIAWHKLNLLGLVAIWFIIPILGFILFRPSLYDNFRQLFFLLPPVFLMAGIVFSKIKQPIWQITLIALAILPGLVDGARLHPYEYIYYNRFIGGVNGAQKRFELDYWATSYREAADYLNNHVPANGYVWVEGPAHVYGPFVREDIKVLDAFDPALNGTEYYVVALSRYNLDQFISPDAKVIYTIKRDGAPLTVIKKP